MPVYYTVLVQRQRELDPIRLLNNWTYCTLVLIAFIVIPL
jgi:hypothetical protein